MDNNSVTTTINFLRARKKEVSAQEKIDRKYALWMTYLLVGVIFLFIFVWGVEFFYSSRITKVKAETRLTESRITQQKNVEEELFSLAEKLSFIDNSLEAKEKKREAITFFTQNFSTADTSLREITFNAEGILQFQLVSNDIFVLQRTVQALQGPAIRDQYSSINLSDIVRDGNGTYRMQVIVVVENSNPGATE